MAIIIFVCCVLVVFGCAKLSRNSNNEKQAEKCFYVRVETNKNEESRCFYGEPLKTNEDWDRWWVLKGFSDAIALRLTDLEKDIKSKTCANAFSKKLEWERRYKTYRMLCINHGMWNVLLEERVRFIPTEHQLNKEKILYERIEKGYQYGQHEREQYAILQAKHQECGNEILQYINAQYRKVAVRHVMLDALSQKDKESRALYLSACKQMKADGMISEGKDKTGKITIRKKRKVNQSYITAENMSQPASVYHAHLYALVPVKTEYKVHYTVGEPLNLNREKNTCEFVSQSCGERYYTSLERCSCPVFQASSAIPCKHMVALAKWLGYFHKSG